MGRRSASPSRNKEDDADGHKLRKRSKPTECQLKLLLYFSCAVKSHARRILEQQDVAHGKRRSRHKPIRHDIQDDIYIQIRHTDSNGVPAIGSQSTPGLPHEERRVDNFAGPLESDDSPSTDPAVPDAGPTDDRIKEPESLCFEGDEEAHVNSEHGVDPADSSRRESRVEEDSEESDDDHSDSDSDSESDSDQDPTPALQVQADDQPEHPVASLEPTASTPAVPLPDAHETREHQIFSEGNIVWVNFKRCPRLCRGQWDGGHMNHHHRGQKHYLVISKVIPEDELTEGFTCTSLEKKRNLSSRQIQTQYLRLEGGDNIFWSSIVNRQGIPSGDGAELFTETGEIRMRRPTYVEITDSKRFPFDQLAACAPHENEEKCRQLKPESLRLLLERTTRP